MQAQLSLQPKSACCREVLIDALSPLGSRGDGIAGGEGAIYLWARLPKGKTPLHALSLETPCPVHILYTKARRSKLARGTLKSNLLLAGCDDDEAVVEWLIKKHGVCVIPGTACGSPGHIRVAFGNLRPDLCGAAAAKLRNGLSQLVREGLRTSVEATQSVRVLGTSSSSRPD